MKIEAATNGDTVILFPEGWIDSSNAIELEQAVAAYVDDCDKLILDFSGIDYISSAGIRVIVAAHREMESKDGLYLRNLNRNVTDLLKLTGFDMKLNIEED